MIYNSTRSNRLQVEETVTITWNIYQICKWMLNIYTNSLLLYFCLRMRMRVCVCVKQRKWWGLAAKTSPQLSFLFERQCYFHGNFYLFTNPQDPLTPCTAKDAEAFKLVYVQGRGVTGILPEFVVKYIRYHPRLLQLYEGRRKIRQLIAW